MYYPSLVKSLPHLNILASFSIFSSLVISLYSSMIFSSSVSFARCTSDLSFTNVDVNSLKLYNKNNIYQFRSGETKNNLTPRAKGKENEDNNYAR